MFKDTLFIKKRLSTMLKFSVARKLKCNQYNGNIFLGLFLALRMSEVLSYFYMFFLKELISLRFIS